MARRALVLTAVVCRSTIDAEAGDAETETLRASLLPWLREVGAEAALSPAEQALLEAPLGSLDYYQRMEGALRSEGLAVLGWALGRCEVPAYDCQSQLFENAQALGFRRRLDSEGFVLREPRLRSWDELTTLAATLRAQHRGLSEGTLEVRGLAPAETAAPLRRAAMSIVEERYRAACWLIGQQGQYPD